MECYSAGKKEPTTGYPTTGMDLQGMHWVEKAQSPKRTCCLILLTQHSWNDKITEVENGLMVAKGEGGCGGEKDERATCRILVGETCSVSWLTQHQYPGCDYCTVVFKMFPVGETERRIQTAISVLFLTTACESKMISWWKKKANRSKFSSKENS